MLILQQNTLAFKHQDSSMFQSNEVPQFPSSSCAPQDFQGVSEFFMRRSISYSGLDWADEMQPDDDMSDDGMQMLGERKRRLTIEQVKALEKSFELGNKLEPERKVQLARALGLKPRQVAIWFQNRRARSKTKQLERDYDVLRKQYDAIKADNDVLQSQNKKLQAEVMALENKDSTRQMINLNKDNEGSWSNGSDQNSCDVNLNMTSTNNNTVYSHSSNKNFFQFAPGANNSLTQLLHGSSNEGYCNMFGGIEENTEFWPWHEQ